MKIKRLVYSRLSEEMGKPFISILIGPRQVGKTYLMRQLLDESARKGLKARYFNLEDPGDLLAFSGNEDQVIRNLKMMDMDILFLDEFHYLKNATRILKVLYDADKNIKVVASGSSSLEIHKHLKESLAGRFRLTIIHPLTPQEMGQMPGYRFDDYLKFGGLPGLIHEDTATDRMALLKNVLQTYLLKDIKALIKEENIRAFNNLLYSLAQNQGQIATMANLARDIGLSEPAVKHHLELMAQTYTCFTLDSYSGNLANELKKVKKYYLYDLGIRNSILNDYSPVDGRNDRGAIAESFVALSIIRQLKPNMEVKFWRTRQGDEVDFILLKNRVPLPVEVKYSLNSLDVPDGIRKFLQKYPDAPNAIVFAGNINGEVSCCNRQVRFMDWRSAVEIDYLRDAE